MRSGRPQWPPATGRKRNRATRQQTTCRRAFVTSSTSILPRGRGGPCQRDVNKLSKERESEKWRDMTFSSRLTGPTAPSAPNAPQHPTHPSTAAPLLTSSGLHRFHTSNEEELHGYSFVDS